MTDKEVRAAIMASVAPYERAMLVANRARAAGRGWKRIHEAGDQIRWLAFTLSTAGEKYRAGRAKELAKQVAKVEAMLGKVKR